VTDSTGFACEHLFLLALRDPFFKTVLSAGGPAPTQSHSEDSQAEQTLEQGLQFPQVRTTDLNEIDGLQVIILQANEAGGSA